MRISYFVYLREEKDAIDYLKKLTNSDFFSNNDTSDMTIFLPNGMKNVKKIKSILKDKCDSTLIYTDDKYSFNDAFYNAVENMEGDVCIMLDSAVKNFTPLVKKCLEKHEKGARIVRVCKRYKGIKAFFHKMWHGIYGFFCKIFTSKVDEENVISLGLIDRYVIDLMKALPAKRCMLKNVTGLYDVSTATIYVDDKKLPEDTVTKQQTKDKRNFIISISLIPLIITALVIANILTSPHPAINVGLIILAIFSIIISCFSLPKHIFLCRNYPLKKTNIKVEKIEKK